MLIMYAAKAVEYGDTESVFSEPLHPYTRMLISSLPTIGDDRARQGIPGRPPSLWGELQRLPLRRPLPAGDRPLPHEEPPLVEHRPGHFAACHYAERPSVPERRRRCSDGGRSCRTERAQQGLPARQASAGQPRKITGAQRRQPQRRERQAGDHQRRRRVRQRQDDAGQDPAAAGRAELGQRDRLRPAWWPARA